MEEYIEYICIICEQKKREGIFIVFEFICDVCEVEMVYIDVQDVKYNYFIY